MVDSYADRNKVYQEYFQLYRNALEKPHKALEFIKKYSNNRPVIGAFAEAYVRKKICEKIPESMYVVHGTITYPEIGLYQVEANTDKAITPQFDCIIGEKNKDLPIVWYGESFAVVPLRTVRCVIEIKTQIHDIKPIKKLTEQLQLLQAVIKEDQTSNQIEGIVIGCFLAYDREGKKKKKKGAIYLFDETENHEFEISTDLDEYLLYLSNLLFISSTINPNFDSKPESPPPNTQVSDHTQTSKVINLQKNSGPYQSIISPTTED